MSNLLTLAVRFPSFNEYIAETLTNKINRLELTVFEKQITKQLKAWLGSAVVIKKESCTTLINADLMLIINKEQINLFSSSERAIKLASALIMQSVQIDESKSKSMLIDVTDSLLQRETATDSVISESDLIESLIAFTHTAQKFWTKKEALTFDNSLNSNAVQHITLFKVL